MNKKKAIGILAVLGVSAYLASVAIVVNDDKRLSKQTISTFSDLDKSSLDYQAMKVIADSGCSYCHTQDSEMPFYRDLPLASNLMEADHQEGLKHFEITRMFNDVRQGDLVSEVALAKLERVLYEETMPPTLYKSMHVTSGLSKEGKHTLLTWVREKRLERHGASPVDVNYKASALQPVYTTFEVNEDQAALGDVLYHDVRLSGDNTISCASCHGLDTGGVDNLVGSVGIHGQVGGINAPTVFNAVYNSLQFWDGRAMDLQEQAGGPPFNPIEMGSEGWDQVIDKLSQDEALMAMFDKAYDGEITGHTITHAIAEFEKTLTTPNSRFDQYLKGDSGALSSQEKHGLILFNQYNCQSCHNGEAMGGDSFEKMGLKADYFADRGSKITGEDAGRFSVTGLESDKHKFKVPTLRNIELTAPYFHDGSAATLEEAIFTMGKYQEGVEIPDHEVDAIKAFLGSLTGELNGVSLKAQS